MYVLTEQLGYVLICQGKEKEKNVILKMLLYRRAKAQQEIKMDWLKDGTEVISKISSNTIGDSNDQNNFLHKLLLTNTQVSRLRKAFTNGSSVNIKLSKTQLHKIG